MTNKFVVFYAWQSDRPERLNRYLIRAALDIAARNISRDSNVNVRIDADTEGVLGHVPVTATILEKIDACDAFVPDLTFVAQTDAGELVCNPNVMLEYGYALRAKSHSVMIPVMNTVYGPAEELPFDMGHLRFPLRYELTATATNDERRVPRKALAGEFEAILRLMIAEHVKRVESVQPKLFQPAHWVLLPAFFFPSGTVIAEVGYPGEQEYRFEGEMAIYLRLYPKHVVPAVGRARLRTIVESRRLLLPMAPSMVGGLVGRNDYGYVTIDPIHSNTTRAITQGFPSGEIWGINSQVFQPARFNYSGRPDQKIISFGVISAERAYTRTLENYVSVASTEMGLPPPWVVEIGAVGLKGVYMGAPHPEVSTGHYYGPIRQVSLVRDYELQDASREAIDGALRRFFNELYDLADISRQDILTDDYVRKNDLPERS